MIQKRFPQKSCNINHSAGFSLVETIVAVAIIAGAVTGPLYLAYLGIRSGRDAKSELIATQLAAEALELVQAKRNSIGAATQTTTAGNWISPVVNRCQSAAPQFGCIIDAVDTDANGDLQDTAFISCNNAQCRTGVPLRDIAEMYQGEASKFYRQKSGNIPSPQWTKTPYRRVTTVDYVDPVSGAITTTATNQVRVTSTVTYPRANGSFATVQISTDLYNWFPYLP